MNWCISMLSEVPAKNCNNINTKIIFACGTHRWFARNFISLRFCCNSNIVPTLCRNYDIPISHSSLLLIRGIKPSTRQLFPFLINHFNYQFSSTSKFTVHCTSSSCNESHVKIRKYSHVTRQAHFLSHTSFFLALFRQNIHLVMLTRRVLWLY